MKLLTHFFLVPLQPEMSPWRQGEVCTDVHRLTEKTLFTNKTNNVRNCRNSGSAV